MLKISSSLFLTAIAWGTIPFACASNRKETHVAPVKEETISDLTLQFARFFTNKDAEAIGTLLTDDFSLFDPALKWLRGKDAVVGVLKKQFEETEKVSYDVVHIYQDGNTGILEFKITLDQLVLYGVDFMEWGDNKKMKQLRCYYNPPDR